MSKAGNGWKNVVFTLTEVDEPQVRVIAEKKIHRKREKKIIVKDPTTTKIMKRTRKNVDDQSPQKRKYVRKDPAIRQEPIITKRKSTKKPKETVDLNLYQIETADGTHQVVDAEKGVQFIENLLQEDMQKEKEEKIENVDNKFPIDEKLTVELLLQLGDLTIQQLKKQKKENQEIKIEEKEPQKQLEFNNEHKDETKMIIVSEDEQEREDIIKDVNNIIQFLLDKSEDYKNCLQENKDQIWKESLVKLKFELSSKHGSGLYSTESELKRYATEVLLNTLEFIGCKLQRKMSPITADSVLNYSKYREEQRSRKHSEIEWVYYQYWDHVYKKICKNRLIETIDRFSKQKKMIKKSTNKFLESSLDDMISIILCKTVKLIKRLVKNSLKDESVETFRPYYKQFTIAFLSWSKYDEDFIYFFEMLIRKPDYNEKEPMSLEYSKWLEDLGKIMCTQTNPELFSEYERKIKDYKHLKSSIEMFTMIHVTISTTLCKHFCSDEFYRIFLSWLVTGTHFEVTETARDVILRMISDVDLLVEQYIKNIETHIYPYLFQEMLKLWNDAVYICNQNAHLPRVNSDLATFTNQGWIPFREFSRLREKSEILLCLA